MALLPPLPPPTGAISFCGCGMVATSIKAAAIRPIVIAIAVFIFLLTFLSLVAMILFELFRDGGNHLAFVWPAHIFIEVWEPSRCFWIRMCCLAIRFDIL
jgi:hypothetical protein